MKHVILLNYNTHTHILRRWVLVLRRIAREPTSLAGRSITPLARWVSRGTLRRVKGPSPRWTRDSRVELWTDVGLADDETPGREDDSLASSRSLASDEAESKRDWCGRTLLVRWRNRLKSGGECFLQMLDPLIAGDRPMRGFARYGRCGEPENWLNRVRK